MRSAFFVLCCCCLLAACEDEKGVRVTPAHEKQIVKVYSGGILIGRWETLGDVYVQYHSTGYYFFEAATGKKVTVTGTVVVQTTEVTDAPDPPPSDTNSLLPLPGHP